MKKMKWNIAAAAAAASLGLLFSAGCFAQDLTDPGNIRNQDDIGEKEILVVSFGTSYNEAGKLSIGGIEDAVETSFTEWSVRRAFTSQTVIDRVKERDDITIDNVEQAMKRAQENGVKDLIIQPTHLSAGYEYEELQKTLESWAGSFDRVLLGIPLLNDDQDYETMVQVLAEDLTEEIDEETAVILFGHGSGRAAGTVFTKLQETFTDAGYDQLYVCADQTDPSIEAVMEQLETASFSKILLHPLTVVAGDYAQNDMASPENEESCYSVLTNAGYSVSSMLEGIGEMDGIQKMYTAHVQLAVDYLER